MKLGVDVFSLRYNDWDVFELLEYAARIGLDVIHFSDLGPFASTDDSYLAEISARAGDLNMDIEVGMGSICPSSTTFSAQSGSAVDQLSQMIRIASALGSPAVRCFLGANADRRTEVPLRQHMAATIETCRAVRSLARELGVKIAIENHAGDLQARELKELVEEAGPDYVGVCIDAGNPLWVAEDPFVTLEQLAPYVLMSHVRDTAVWPHPQGAVVQWVAMGEGTVGIDRWTTEYMAACPQTSFTLEIITSIPPKIVHYLDAQFWTAYPETPAREFARFLSLVQNGKPYTNPVLTVDATNLPHEYKKAIAIQQQRMLEKSVAYCRESLGI